MRRNYLFLGTYALLFAAWILFGSNASNPPNGRTNAPFDGYCTGCHNPSSAFNGQVDLSGLPDTVVPGEQYAVTLSVKYTQGSPARAGFQLVSVFASDNTNAGEVSNLGGGVGTNNSGGRTYIEHRGARNFSDSTASWTFDWTAPQGDNGTEIKMYYAGNIANGNGGTSGDRPISSSTTIVLGAGAAPLVASVVDQNDVSCFGNNDGSATVQVSGGVEPYEYAWSSGGNLATENNLVAGSYQVTISDASQGETILEVSISEPDELVATISVTNASCQSAADAMGELDIQGGTAPYDFAWSNGSENRTTSTLEPGTYSMTVEDAKGCTTSASYSIMAVDEELPAFANCPTDVSISVNDTLSFALPEASDNCGIDTIIQVAGLPSGSTFPEGLTVVTFLARDVNGNEDSCSFTVEASINTATIDTDLDQNISIFPNPVEDYLQINAEINHPLDLVILDGVGRVVINQKVDQQKKVLDASNLAPGFYFAKFSAGEKWTFKKFLKK